MAIRAAEWIHIEPIPRSSVRQKTMLIVDRSYYKLYDKIEQKNSSVIDSWLMFSGAA